MSETAAKKTVQKLQRAIVDGLEDVKAQDIRVFDTEHLSPLFERVIVASGTSNRQTKALAASVRDKVREDGFGKPRTEGEDNGEWIIVDCGAVVAHIMQPAIREYYRLEEIWGDKPVRLKGPASKSAAARGDSKKKTAPASAESAPKATKKVAKAKPASAAPAPAKASAKKVAAKKAPAKTAAARPATARKAPAKAPAARARAGSASAAPRGRASASSALQTVVVNPPAVKPARAAKAAASKPAGSRATPAKAAPAKSAARKTAPRAGR